MKFLKARIGLIEVRESTGVVGFSKWFSGMRDTVTSMNQMQSPCGKFMLPIFTSGAKNNMENWIVTNRFFKEEDS